MENKIEKRPKANERPKAKQSKWTRILDVILIILLSFVVLREGMMAVITVIQTNYELTLGDMGLTIQQANVQGCILAVVVFVLSMLSVMLMLAELRNGKELKLSQEILTNVAKTEKAKGKKC